MADVSEVANYLIAYAKVRNSRLSKEKLNGLLYYVQAWHLLLSLFEEMRFPIRSEFAAEFGALPLTIIEAPAGAIRPPDNVVAQVCKFLGTDAAEEVADLDAWNKLPDPMENWFRSEVAKFGVEMQGG